MPTCVSCKKSRPLLDLRQGVCSVCRKQQERAVDLVPEETLASARRTGNWAAMPDEHLDALSSHIIMTTAQTLPGVDRYDLLRIVTAHCVSKAIAGFRFTDPSADSEATLDDCMQACLARLRREAFKYGADAVIAVHIDTGDVTYTEGVAFAIMVVASGTAIRFSGSEDQSE